ncbi:MAG: protein translocase subunit SecDF, partial [Mesorhizobium sp.]
MLYFSRLKMILIWLAVAATVVLAAPNLFPASTLAQLPNWVPKRQMTLGLDLQGGSHILLQMNQNDLIKDRLETSRDEIRTLLRDANPKINYTGLSGSGRTVQVRITDPSQIDAAKKVLKPLTDPVAAGLFTGGSVQEMTLDDSEPGLLKFTVTDAGIKYRTSTALTQSIEVVERRVNELGTTEPIVQRQGDDRILVQVPGLQDPQRLKEILGQTAKLTFQMVDQSMPVQDALNGRPPAGSS